MDLTRELALLVNMQGEQLNTIEDALTTARDHVDNGEVKLIEAKVLHKKSRKVAARQYRKSAALLCLCSHLLEPSSSQCSSHNYDP